MIIEKSNYLEKTPIQAIWSSTENNLYVKRDDLFPLCMGGNKARKGRLFFKDILGGNADYVVTYGSGSSNHCRVIAGLASQYGLPCLIVSPEESKHDTANSRMAKTFGAEYRYCPLQQVAEVISAELDMLRKEGRTPYFIPGGGHGNIGTQAYVEAYREIEDFSTHTGIAFDYIFFASGTGTTHAGLICGQYLSGNDEQRIVGISIARSNPRGKKVVIDSVNEYMGKTLATEDNVEFVDKYICGGYGSQSKLVDRIILQQIRRNGLPLDRTYTGKAFFGMEQYLLENRIKNKNILFLHTGGTPLFYDDLESII